MRRAAALFLVLAFAAHASGIEAGYRLVAVIPVNNAVLEAGDESQPLLPLFKQECSGGGLVVVYGPRHGEPLFIAVYSLGNASAQGLVDECLEAAAPCLAAVGAAPATPAARGSGAATPGPGCTAPSPRSLGAAEAAALAVGVGILVARLWVIARRRRG